MDQTYKKLYTLPLKSIIQWTLRSLLTLHIAYIYVSSFSIKSFTKGGTYIEATTDSLGFLPYSRLNSNNSIAQQLLFRSCIQPIFSGVNITYTRDLCSISTKNQKTFVVTVIPDQAWSDGVAISIEDIYFTYKTLLKDNFWNIPEHESYKSITIEPYVDKIIITFPYASIDNESFFTNPILAAHKVANISFAEYIQEFSKNPVVSSCARKKTQVNDNASLIIDLTDCPEYPYKLYQIKQFSSPTDIQHYIQEHPTTLDSIIANSFSGFVNSEYKQEVFLTQSFLVAFFNEQKSLISLSSKQHLLGYFNRLASLLSGTFIPDSYIFDINTTSYSGLANSLLQDQVEPRYFPTNIPDLLLFTGLYHQSYSINHTISDKITTTFVLPVHYDKISLFHNENEESILSSYTRTNSSASYSFSPLLRNITIGLNNYTIQGYSGNIPTDTYRFNVFYGPWSGSVINPKEIGSGQQSGETISGGLYTNIKKLPAEYILPIHILYFDEQPISNFIDLFRKELQKDNLEYYFILEGIKDKNLYEGKLQTKDYDIIFSIISLGLRKDISNIFVSDTPTLNPSLYVNQNLSNEISKYFLSEGDSKQKSYDMIQSIYKQTIPLGFIGKLTASLYIKDSFVGKLAKRIPNISRRGALLTQSTHEASLSSIDRKTAFSRKGAISYITSSVQLKK